MVDVTCPLLTSEDRKSIPFPDSELGVEHVKAADELKYRCNYSNHIRHTGKDVMPETIRVVTIFDITVLQQSAE